MEFLDVTEVVILTILGTGHLIIKIREEVRNTIINKSKNHPNSIQK